MESRRRLIAAMAAAVIFAAIAGNGKAAEPKGPAKAEAVEHVDPQGAARMLHEKKAVVLDIRTPREFQGGHLAAAKNIDFNASGFEKKVSELDRDATYVVYCQSGGRSTRSLEVFKKLGFKSIVHLDGGYRSWEKAGLPVER